MLTQNFGVTNKEQLWYVMVFSGVVNSGHVFYVYYWRCMGALILIGHPSHAKVYPFAGHILQRDHYTFLGNCPPTPPLTQHKHLLFTWGNNVGLAEG